MRKILFFFGLIPFMGCSNGHVYRTIYGKVDIDTIDDKWPEIIIIIIAIGLR